MAEDQNKDLRKDGHYDFTKQVNRTMDDVFQSQFSDTGGTLFNFNFDSYSGATLQVRKSYDNPTVVLEFNTNDGSIVLGIDGQFSFNKTASEMNVRSGEYVYDMYLIPNGSPNEKREFLRGKFILTQKVTN